MSRVAALDERRQAIPMAEALGICAKFVESYPPGGVAAATEEIISGALMNRLDREREMPAGQKPEGQR